MTYKPNKLGQTGLLFSLWSKFISRSVNAGLQVSKHAAMICATVRQLHWLPMQQRVQLKVAVLVFQCLSDNTLTYLSDDCQLIADNSMRQLRLTDTTMCAV